MKHLVLVAGLSIFALVSIAVRYHFVSAVTPPRFVALGVASVVNIVVFAREVSLRGLQPILGEIAIGCFVISAALFLWALQASRSSRLKLIYDEARPDAILQAGPYRFIRHPFYASYVVFWLGIALATLHPVSVAYEVCLVPLLVLAACAEEKSFEQSTLAADYARYRRTAGLMWPKLIGRHAS